MTNKIYASDSDRLYSFKFSKDRSMMLDLDDNNVIHCHNVHGIYFEVDPEYIIVKDNKKFAKVTRFNDEVEELIEINESFSSGNKHFILLYFHFDRYYSPIISAIMQKHDMIIYFYKWGSIYEIKNVRIIM